MIRATSSLRCHACRTASSLLLPLKSNHTSISIIAAHRSIHSSGSRRNTRGTSQGDNAKQAQKSRSNSNNSNAFVETPAPPRLPPHLQKEFEELQRIAASPLAATSTTTTNSSNSDDIASLEEHPDIRQKPKPEFEGDKNPKTGEIGGPKNNPLSYEKEWTYGGRATDF